MDPDLRPVLPGGRSAAPRPRGVLLRRTSSHAGIRIVLVAALLAGCNSAPAQSRSASSVSYATCSASGAGRQVAVGTPPSGGISETAAQAIAAHQANTISAFPVTYLHLCVGRLHGTDPGAGPGLGEPLNAWVWQFFFSGRFYPPSCGPAPLPGQSPHPCPAPQTTIQVVLDYMSGKFVEMGTPTN